MYTLKSIAKRGSMLSVVAAVLAATIIPSAAVFADSLNPLTERSLLLSSSAPGFQNTDGSGNSNDLPNAINENYAPAGSGPNGEKTGETFTFRVSADSVADSRPIKAMTFQYCTTAAGVCQSPGNNAGDARDSDRLLNSDPLTVSTSDLDVNYTGAVAGTDFEMYMDFNDDGDFLDAGEDVTTITDSAWTLTATNEEDDAHSGDLTGARNFITLADTGDEGFSPVTNTKVQIVFNATETNYITNPGDDEFFVKINTYDSNDSADHIQNVPAATNTSIIDGGVTVANVMTDSIHITTKVLETMSFSVGNRNPDTVDLTSPAVHGTCASILQEDENRLQLGNPDAEYSLETDTAYDVYSYWRLSSNSSGGATVYYSGNTLANTVGDQIAPIGPDATTSTVGTEQFGLGFVDAYQDDIADFDSDFIALTVSTPDRYQVPQLEYLVPEEDYADATGTINGVGPTATFAFEQESNTEPRVIAQNNDHVISCDTAKMRYVANIGADTPAGVYTTKINYLAAPQY